MSRWRKYQQQARAAVYRDILEEAGLFPFRRYQWKPDLRERGFESIFVQTPRGRIEIIPSRFVPDDGVVIANEIDRSSLNPVFVSPRAWAQLNSDMAAFRTYDASYQGRIDTARQIVDAGFVSPAEGKALLDSGDGFSGTTTIEALDE